MAAIAGVDHVDVVAAGVLEVLGDQVRGAAGFMAHHEHVGLHRAEVVDRVEQGLALFGGRGGHVEVDHVGRQALGGDLEGGAGARAVLEEQVEDALAAQQRSFLTSRSAISVKGAAVSRIWVMMLRGRPSRVSRCCSSPCLLSWGLRMDQPHREGAGIVALELQVLPGGQRLAQGEGAEAGRDGQLAPAAVDQHGQVDRAGRP
jgi:hypothetical protein